MTIQHSRLSISFGVVFSQGLQREQSPARRHSRSAGVAVV
jgi:hypothetical protein